CYLVGLAPAPWVLTRRSGYRIFQNKTTKEIADEALKDAGVPADHVVWRLSRTYVPRLHCVQYGETEWAFVERLLADEGINYWFDTKDDGTPIVVLGDDNGAHDSITGSATIPYEDPGGLVPHRRVFDLEVVDQMTTKAVHVRDYDMRAPDAPVEG